MRIIKLLLSISLSIYMIGCRRHERAPIAAPSAPTRALPGDDDERSPLAAGAKKWRDTGVYLDGKPIGVLSFGELPIGLAPVWIEQKHSAEIAPGSHDSGFTVVQERRYRFVDYLRALGVDLKRLRALHVMGPKIAEVIVVSGAELRSAKGRGFLFRFGGIVGGKAIPVLPAGFGNGMKPDKIACVMAYVDREPPVLVPGEGLQLDGITVTGVPYFGEPLRGGVRIYRDDRLAMVIKRPLLRATTPVAMAGTQPRYRLWDLLGAHGVDTEHVVEGWLIAGERRTQRLSQAQLAALTFEVGEKEKNEIRIGDSGLRASAIALHAHALSNDELPAIRSEEEN